MPEPSHAPTLPSGQGGAQQQAHTPEPWEVDVANAEDECWAVAAAVDPKGASLVAICASGADKPNQANARRIVACVNACKDWDTETLEQWASDPKSPLLTNKLNQLAEAQRTEGALRVLLLDAKKLLRIHGSGEAVNDLILAIGVVVDD